MAAATYALSAVPDPSPPLPTHTHTQMRENVPVSTPCVCVPIHRREDERTERERERERESSTAFESGSGVRPRTHPKTAPIRAGNHIGPGQGIRNRGHISTLATRIYPKSWKLVRESVRFLVNGRYLGQVPMPAHLREPCRENQMARMAQIDRIDPSHVKKWAHCTHVWSAPLAKASARVSSNMW